MAQKILLRRGPVSNIASVVTAQGELLLVSGSISDLAGPFITMTGTPGTGASTIVGKIYEGATAPSIASHSPLTGTPFYATGNKTLFRLNHAGNQALDLSGNLEGGRISNIIATGSFSGSFTGNGSGLTNLTLSSITAPGTNTQILFNNAGAIGASSNLTVTGTAFNAATLNIITTGNISGSNLKLTGNADITGNINLGGNITLGDADVDFVSFKADVSSSIIPDIDSIFDLGSTTKYWSTVYADNFSGSAGSIAAVTTLNATDANITGTISGSALRVVNNADIGGNLTVPNLRGYNSLFGTPSSAVTNFTVTVVTKSANHRYSGTGSGLGYHIDGVESPFITLLPGKTYRFLQDDYSNDSHQILFYYKADKSTPGQYTTNVTTNGTAGSAGSYTQIVVTDTTPVVLHYQCVNHEYMGNSAQLNSNVVDTPYEVFARSGITVTGSAVLGGSLSVAGLTNLNGNVVLGDAAADTVAFKADVSSSILPSATNTFDIGSSTDAWRTGFFGTGVSSSGFLHAATNLDVDGNALISGTSTLNGEVTANTGLVPDTDNGAYIGQPAQRFQLHGVNSSISGSFSGSFSGEVANGLDLFTITGAGAGSGTDLIESGETLTLTNASTHGFSFTVSSNQVALNTPQDLRTTSSPAFLGVTAGNVTVGVSTDNTITTSTGNLTLDSTDGTLVVNDNLDLNGTADISGNVTLSGNSQTVTHSGTGNLTISSTSGNTLIEGTTFAGNNVTIPGNLTVQGTTTTIDSTTVNIGDNIIVLNAAGIVADAGIQVLDTIGTTGTGSLLWNATSDYWYAGLSGSTHYRLATFDNASPSANSIKKVDSDGRLVASTITDDGTLVTVAGNISGNTITASTGFVAAGLTGVIDTSSRVVFRDASNRLGALATSDSAVVVSTVLGYKADGTLVATSVIDGGTF